MDPVQIGGATAQVMDRIEQIMKNRRSTTAEWKDAWDAGELPKSVLPCHDACNGTIILSKDGRQAKGQCPAFMVEDVCPLVGKAERELRERLELAGFAPRYHTPDPARIPARSVVEEYLGNLAANLKAGRGLLLTGNTGVGKTFAMAYLARRMLVENHGVWKIHASDLVMKLEDVQQRKQVVERCLKVEVLMLDDWGTATMPPWVLSIMDGIVEARNGRLAPVIVSTNMRTDELFRKQEYRRIVDRWKESTAVVRMGDASQRGVRRADKAGTEAGAEGKEAPVQESLGVEGEGPSA